MRYIEFVPEVEQRAAGGLDHEQAQGAIRATLATLGEYMSAKETSDLAAQFPRELKAMLDKRTSTGEPLPPREFCAGWPLVST